MLTLLTVLGTSSLISLLVWLLVMCVVLYIVWLILSLLPIPNPAIKNILIAIICLIALLIFIDRFFGVI